MFEQPCCECPLSNLSGRSAFDELRPFEMYVRLASMTDTIDDLRRRMQAASRALDFEEAKRCRDKINLMRGGATATEAVKADTSGLSRQQPGAMGLGTSQQRIVPPSDWKPPRKPDLMTSGRSSRNKRR
jgi:hypothetical protein